MRKIINTSLLLFIGNHFLLSQNSHGTTTKNYVYEKTCLDASCVKKIENIQYLDGLNRPQQVISIKATPQGNDMVIPFEYDNYGVQSKSYLPIPQTSTGNGSFNTSPTSNGTGFYGTSKFYSEFVHDGSFLTKVSEQSNPGDEWALSSGKTQKSSIDINKNSDAVKKHMIKVSWDDTRKVLLNTISKINQFNEGELYKTIITDEDSNRTITFKNKLGQTVLIRKENNSAGNIVNLDTYYVYNFYSQLVYVIPPLAAVKTMIDQSTLDNLCYQYKYDIQGRLVEKKLPGKGLDASTGVWRWDSFVYDQSNRLILTQDANLQQQGKWMITKYDRFGRVIYTGTIPGGDRTSMQNQAGNLAIVESRDVTGFTKNGIQIYYTNGLFTGMDTVLSVNYYDTYPQGTPVIPSSILTHPVLPQDALSSATSISTKSLPTASYVKNIEDDNWTKKYIWYDMKGRAIGSHSVNDVGGYTKTESELGFAGEVKESYTYHKKTEYDEETIIKESFVYDNQNRLTIRKHKVNSNPEEILAVNNYNELSQIRSKQIGGTGSNPIQTVDYTYNIRGWVTGINNPSNLNDDLFGYTIKYNNPESSSSGKFNGNIAQIDWKASDDGTLRRYDYQYDGLDRLLSGVYSEPGSFVPANNFYNESLTYDLNGNILSLVRKAKGFSQTEIKIDDLTYVYTGNRLDSVTDSSTNYSGYPDVSGNLISYDSNGNMKDHIDKGILQIDYNILNLPKYIKFNQTYAIRNPFGGTQQSKNITTRYTYRADGTKLRKVYTYGIAKNNSEGNKVTEYYDGFQYDAEGVFSIVPPLLRFVPTVEGYYDFVQNKYVYQYKDQVGNIRLAYYRDANNNTKINRTSNFYPFGMEFNNSNNTGITPNYNYGFQGQEKQTDTNWNSFKWRNYDPSIGRFFNIDPLSEKYAYQSHYNFSENRVVNSRELEGLEAQDNNDEEYARYENRPVDEAVDYEIREDGEKEWQSKPVDASYKEQDRAFQADLSQENDFDLGNAINDAFFGLGSQDSWDNYRDNSSRFGAAVAASPEAQAANGFYYMFGGMLAAPIAMGATALYTGAVSASSYLSMVALRGGVDAIAQYSVNGSVNLGQTAINGIVGGSSGALNGIKVVGMNVAANTINSAISNAVSSGITGSGSFMNSGNLSNLGVRGTTSSFLLGAASLGAAKTVGGKVVFEVATQFLFNLADKGVGQEAPAPVPVEK
ncbi:RHS repeat-associated core domain-containing protein [Chryseobacterium pennae]|uniref:RHS repeat-associated core domain-containing protein n=1 Tax=Chryseobacterium pennae TaxID=2258962 RepID=A0A3D9C646_9FLAO|nr:DUF6443 domain-containing protein [Chryseobacterium pennae]REC61229.1 RHS repeat-associated core domain-containing protein [Chryseobacterium pennae]